jgi:pyruvate dehydrogenase E1 component
MYGESPEDVFYYLTVYNEPYLQPEEPADVDVDGILRGMHLWSPAAEGVDGPRVQLLASGVAVPWAMQAQQWLAQNHGVAADVWSVTSWNELRRDALACDAAAFGYPADPAPVPFIQQRLAQRPGPVIAVSDYLRAVADQLAPWVPELASLGTDGWGMSDTRGALRRHFKVDAASITVRALQALGARGDLPVDVGIEAVTRYGLHDVAAADPGLGMGDA